MPGAPAARARTTRLGPFDDQAVSAVVAVLLMVAVTVLMSASAYVFFSDAGSASIKSAPALSFVVDERTDRVQVAGTEPEADWQRVSVRLDSIQTPGGEVHLGSSSPYQNQDATLTGTILSSSAPTRISVSGARILAGDFLGFCGSVAGAPAGLNGVQLRILDNVASYSLAQLSILNIDPC